MCLNFRKSSGYTLVELMVALVLSGIAVIVIYRSFVAFRVGAEIQAQEAEINQNLRVGINRLSRELQMAGYDPTGSAESGFVGALLATSVTFTVDYNVDENLLGDSDFNGNPFEDDNVTYSWGGTDGDPLLRNDNGACPPPNECWDTIIPNVSVLRFYYLTDDDPPLETAVRDDVRNVDIFLIVRATNEDFSYVNDRAYATGAPYNFTLLDKGPAPDNFRRKMMTVRVKNRNMGLE